MLLINVLSKKKGFMYRIFPKSFKFTEIWTHFCKLTPINQIDFARKTLFTKNALFVMKQNAPEYKEAEKAIRAKLGKELPGDLSYHGMHHTEDVLNAALKIAKTEKISLKDTKLLRLAVLLHDAGFIFTYKGHEEMGSKIAREILPAFKLSHHDIELICGMIMATKIPQTPDTLLERIICDADLDYLGRDDVYPIADTLYREIKLYINPISAEEWNNLQISFLEAHAYFTKFSKTKRTPAKLRYLNQLKGKHIAV